MPRDTGALDPASAETPLPDHDGWVSDPDRRAPLREALRRYDQYERTQTAGRFYPVACIALEVTQRCNLDCTLCYLSERAEAVHDIPLGVLLRRIDRIAERYGPGTNIQITGGDPTLRAVDDLESLCRAIREHGMRSCLMTNGIKARRAMLERLSRAGLDDIAFHVDITQERKGYENEETLNSLRERYIRESRGLGLRVMFNTTVCEANLADIPALSRFFRNHARDIALVSFQLQADTGRGVLRKRPDTLTRAAVIRGIKAGMETDLHFDAISIGHSDCNRFTMAAVAGQSARPIFDDRQLVSDICTALEAVENADRDAYLDIRNTLRRTLRKRPMLALRAVRHGVRIAWALRNALWKSGGRVDRLSIETHNFMAADELEKERCECCVFRVATEAGPVSMCRFNADRDAYLFKPIPVTGPNGAAHWQAANGKTTSKPPTADATLPSLGAIPAKMRKGWLRLHQTCVPGDPIGAAGRDRFQKLGNADPNSRSAGEPVPDA